MRCVDYEGGDYRHNSDISGNWYRLIGCASDSGMSCTYYYFLHLYTA